MGTNGFLYCDGVWTTERPAVKYVAKGSVITPMLFFLTMKWQIR